jgi:hypothetical protein
MSQPPDVIPTGSLDEKLHPEKYMGQSRRALPIEMILITIVVLFLIAVLALLILGSLQSVNTANTYLPTVPAPTK